MPKIKARAIFGTLPPPPFLWNHLINQACIIVHRSGLGLLELPKHYQMMMRGVPTSQKEKDMVGGWGGEEQILETRERTRSSFTLLLPLRSHSLSKKHPGLIHEACMLATCHCKLPWQYWHQRICALLSDKVLITLWMSEKALWVYKIAPFSPMMPMPTSGECMMSTTQDLLNHSLLTSFCFLLSHTPSGLKTHSPRSFLLTFLPYSV